MSLLSLPSSLRYYLYNGTTDMGKSYNGLAIVVRSQLRCSPLNADVFIFLNKHRNQVKLLLWQADGLGIYQKRLEKGSFELPKQGADGPRDDPNPSTASFYSPGSGFKKRPVPKALSMS